jgi:hypothetical protein
MRRVLLTAAALAVAVCAPAGAATKAYWRIDVQASQHVEWSEHATVKGCSNSVLELSSSGTGDIKAHDHAAPWAVAVKESGRPPALLVHGLGPGLAADGSYKREWTQDAFFSKPPDDPAQCSKPLQGTPDCGTRSMPQGALLYLAYEPGKLTLSGPYVPDWVGMPPFTLCGGANGDDNLGGTWYDPSQRPTAALPAKKLFGKLGKAKPFTVSYHKVRTVQTAIHSGAYLADDHPVKTTTNWKVKFTRIGAQLQTPEGY